MKSFSLIVLVVGMVCSSSSAGPIIYDAWSQVRLEITGFRAGDGAVLPDGTDGLFASGSAEVSIDWANATGSALAATGSYVVVDAADPLGMQVGDAVIVRSEVTGQTLSPGEISEAISFVQGSIFLMNQSDLGCMVDLRLDWEYAASGPSQSDLLAADFWTDHLWRSSYEGGPSADSGSENIQVWLEPWDLNQVVIGAYSEGWTPVVPAPPSAALALGMLGILRAARRRIGLWRQVTDSGGLRR